MKKKFCLLFLLSLLLLPSCNKGIEKINFTAGVFNNEILDISSDTLLSKMLVMNDDFVVATHKGNDCLCWADFKMVLEGYNAKRKSEGKTFIPFFAYDTDNNYIDDLAYKGIDRVSTGYIDLYIIKEGTVINKYTSTATKDARLFSTIEGVEEIFGRHIGQDPVDNLYYLPFSGFEDVKNKEENFVLFSTRSGCPDCSSCLKNTLYPYLEDNNLRTHTFIIDIQDYYGIDSLEYKECKNILNLSYDGNNIYGYENGFLPTYQYWKDGNVIDAGVYLNDIVASYYDYERFDDSYYVIEKSYFDGSRPLKYTNEILQGKISKTQDEIEKFHKGILLSFLSYYC